MKSALEKLNEARQASSTPKLYKAAGSTGAGAGAAGRPRSRAPAPKAEPAQGRRTKADVVDAIRSRGRERRSKHFTTHFARPLRSRGGRALFTTATEPPTYNP